MMRAVGQKRRKNGWWGDSSREFRGLWRAKRAQKGLLKSLCYLFLGDNYSNCNYTSLEYDFWNAAGKTALAGFLAVGNPFKDTAGSIVQHYDYYDVAGSW